ncbi:MAG: 30S ribosome-binding factor RbfA [Desulforhabdus sp.]|jgi:ribosome-binding factor A|nr:30S ribosome-binding factor RbfA [Desulforhabdus sp.]
MEYKRSDRVADLLQREIADLLFRRVKDPRVSGITITGAEVSADLRHAKIFYCVMGSPNDEEKLNASKGLAKARGFIRQQLGKRLHMRYLPELEFHYDASFDYGDKMDRLLKELQQDE